MSELKVPHGAVVVVWKGTMDLAQLPWEADEVDYGVGVDTDDDGISNYIDWGNQIEKTAVRRAADYATHYDSGQYRDYAEEDFYAGFMAAINYIKTQDDERID